MLKCTEEPLPFKDEQGESNYSPALSHHELNSTDPTSDLARAILAEVMLHRRFLLPEKRCLADKSPKKNNPETKCAISPCEKCLSPHLSNILSAVRSDVPVTFVLPAFPGKSPNTAKVLGPLPDMAERCALEFLQQLCDRITQIYAPGSRIILCADGRVFSDAVGMGDDDVTAYQLELARLISEMKLFSISTFNLDELYEGMSFSHMRTQLMKNHGEQLEILQRAVSRGGKNPECSVDDKEAHRLYCGITRFLVEDGTFPGQKKSRSALQKECRVRAYEVIQRSKAWGNLIEKQFPNAVRLSIHPQTCGAKKLGICLAGKASRQDSWLTPWHGVVVDVAGHFTLLKRAQAENLGAHLIYRDGRPSHYVLTDENEILKLRGAHQTARSPL